MCWDIRIIMVYLLVFASIDNQYSGATMLRHSPFKSTVGYYDKRGTVRVDTSCHLTTSVLEGYTILCKGTAGRFVKS